MTGETTMTQESQRRPWTQKRKQKQKTMDGKLITYSKSKSYLVESFVLNSENREISRKGKGRTPDPSFERNNNSIQQLSILSKLSGGKVRDIDFALLTSHFENYVKVVNIILSRIYMTDKRAQFLGKALSEYRGRAYTLLWKETDLCYKHNDVYKELVYERLHRNALEHAGRTLLADYTRRALFSSAIKVLAESSDDSLKLLRRKRIPADLLRRVRDSCDAVKNNGSGYHYTLGVLRQIRLALDRSILDSMGLNIGWRGRQRKKVSSLIKENSPEYIQIKILVETILHKWDSEGYSLTVPQLRRNSLDFSASTENNTGQGYWFTLDLERENEVLLHLKLPPGIIGPHPDASPYKEKTLTLRFLDWLPRAASEASEKAQKTEEIENFPRAEKLRFQAAKFEDMHQQLKSTIELQHLTHNLIKLQQKKVCDECDVSEVLALESRIKELKQVRRSAPPRLLLRDNRIILQIPFLSPNGEVSSKVLGTREYDNRAGVDRGIRVPVVLSVKKEQEYTELLLKVEYLIGNRECLRKQAYRIQSVADKKKQNWERKRKGLSYPGYILKKERHIDALWRKVRRLDREVARLIASETVWFCEEHRVKTLFFEDLRSFQAHAGSKDLSYNLSSNLWGVIIDTVRYMRESLGHSKYNVWTVNPRYTSQTCHVCGKRGLRVKDETSTIERKGGEYFYCSECGEHFHADVNAARNIIHVHPGPSVVSGRTA